MSNTVITFNWLILIKVWQTRFLSHILIPLLWDNYLVLTNSLLYLRKTSYISEISVLVYFNHVVLILKMKYPRIFLLVTIFLKVVTEGHCILHVFDEDVVASFWDTFIWGCKAYWLATCAWKPKVPPSIASPFPCCSMNHECLGVHRLYTSKFNCHYHETGLLWSIFYQRFFLKFQCLYLLWYPCIPVCRTFFFFFFFITSWNLFLGQKWPLLVNLCKRSIKVTPWFGVTLIDQTK